MSVNSSSSSNDSLLHPVFNFSMPFNLKCIITTPGSIIFLSFDITCILLLLPLCILVLHHGLHQWRQKRSTSSALSVSHSDSFTYNMVTMELLRMFGGTIFLCGIFMVDSKTLLGGLFVFSFSWFGQMFFHLLTCVERYLAVVHPITYLSLKTERGIRIRNIIIGCVWLLCFALLCMQIVEGSLIVNVCVLMFCLSAVSFCSLSVLCVLIRSGPGEKGGDRQRVDQSKLRAFYTITAILGLLALRFVWGMTWILSTMEESYSNCVIMVCEVWFDLLSSLVLPLLYLHRAGKLECCKKIINVCKNKITSNTRKE